jgi:hypothetical protein
MRSVDRQLTELNEKITIESTPPGDPRNNPYSNRTEFVFPDLETGSPPDICLRLRTFINSYVEPRLRSESKELYSLHRINKLTKLLVSSSEQDSEDVIIEKNQLFLKVLNLSPTIDVKTSPEPDNSRQRLDRNTSSN